MSFFSRVAMNLADKVLVQKLANNPTFQRFAVRSVDAVQGGAKGVKAAASDAAALAREKAATAASRPQRSQGFFSVLKDEVMQDINKVAKR